ncbi:cyclic AMP-dependent transcription factor ATF-3-like [Glandiceps talaboti]
MNVLQINQATSTDWDRVDKFPESDIMSSDPSAAIIQNEIMPMLIKEGLKFAIQAKRKAHGLNELKVEDRQIKPDILTLDEELKRRRRRERNRIAAAKCRTKKRDKAETLEQETKRLQQANAKLKANIARLESEKKYLSETLQSHLVLCLMRPTAELNASTHFDESTKIPTADAMETPFLPEHTAVLPVSHYTGGLQMI